MKKFIAGFICTIILLTSTVAFAETTETIQAVFGRVKLFVDGEAVAQETLLYNGTTYVPLRAAAVVLDKEVSYDDASKTAYITSPVLPQVTPEPTSTPSPTPTPAPEVSEVAVEKARIAYASALLDAFIDAKLPITDDRKVNYREDTGIGDREYVEKIKFKDARYGKSDTSHGVIIPEFEIIIYEDNGALLEAMENYIDKQGYTNTNPMFYHYYYYDNVLLLIPETVKFKSILEYEKVFDEVVK